jgi:hypothetical protein
VCYRGIVTTPAGELPDKHILSEKWEEQGIPAGRKKLKEKFPEEKRPRRRK